MTEEGTGYEPVEMRGMDEEERALADLIYASIQSYSRNSERGLQAQEFRVGVSDLGYCSERLRRMLDQQVPEDTDLLAAFIGTALGDHMEAAVGKSAELFEGAATQIEVEVTLTGERNEYTLTGHPDIVLPAKGIVLDGKTAYGLALARRVGADQQKRFQRHLYGKGAWLAGWFGEMPLEEVRVGNVWLDRSGVEKEVHVELEPFSDEVVAEAGVWLDDVVYAYVNGEQARKEPAREVCAATCGFYRVCREHETDVTGLLTDPTVISAVEMYREGADLEKAGRALKAQAKPVLEGIAGSTGQFSLRWIHVNETLVAEHTKRAHDRIEIRPIKR